MELPPNNVVPLRPNRWGAVLPPAGQAADVNAAVIADYRSSSETWRLLFFIALGVAGYEYFKYVKPDALRVLWRDKHGSPPRRTDLVAAYG